MKAPQECAGRRRPGGVSEQLLRCRIGLQQLAHGYLTAVRDVEVCLYRLPRRGRQRCRGPCRVSRQEPQDRDTIARDAGPNLGSIMRSRAAVSRSGTGGRGSPMRRALPGPAAGCRSRPARSRPAAGQHPDCYLPKPERPRPRSEAMRHVRVAAPSPDGLLRSRLSTLPRPAPAESNARSCSPCTTPPAARTPTSCVTPGSLDAT